MRKFEVVKLRNGLSEAERQPRREWKRLFGDGGSSDEAKKAIFYGGGNSDETEKGFLRLAGSPTKRKRFFGLYRELRRGRNGRFEAGGNWKLNV